MSAESPTVSVTLSRAATTVLFDWLMTVDLNSVPITHPAEKQALADLLTQIEVCTDVPVGASGTGLTQDEIDVARSEVAKDMGW